MLGRILATSLVLVSWIEAQDSITVLLDEQQLRDIYTGIQKYVIQKGDGQHYPGKLTQIVQAGFLKKDGLRSKADRAPTVTDGIQNSYESAFDTVKEQIDTNIPSNIPLVWTKPTTHKTVHLILLKDSRVLKLTSSEQFRDLISGWRDGNYLKSQGMGRLKTEEILTRLREEPENQDMEATVALLASRGPSILPSLFETLSWFVPEQQNITKAIVKEMAEAAEPVLLESLGSREADVRRRSLELLAEIKSEKVVERYHKMLSLKYKSVRLQALDAFSVLKYPSTIPLLMEIAKGDGEAEEKAAALQALAAFAGEQAKALFLEGLKHEESKVRLACAHALARLKDQTVLKPLLGMLAKATPDEKSSVLASLVQLGSQDALRVLKGELTPKMTTPERCITALDTVGRMRLMSFLPLVLPLLEDKNPEIQVAAIRAVASLGNRAVLPTLMKKRNEKSYRIKRAVNAAIAELEQYGPIQLEVETLRPGDFALVLTDKVPVHQGQTVVGSLSKDSTIQVIDMRGTWYKVDVGSGDNTRSGWVSGKSLQKYSDQQVFPFLARTRHDQAKVMVGQREVASLPANQPAMIFDGRSGWYYAYVPQQRWLYTGWIAANFLEPASPSFTSTPPFKMKLLNVAGLPRPRDPGITHMVVSPNGHKIVTSNSEGRLEIWEIGQDQKVETLNLNATVIDMALRADQALLVATSKDIRELSWNDEFSIIKTHDWVRKDLKQAVLFPEQGRGVFPYQKTDIKSDRLFWRLAVETYLKNDVPQASPPPKAPLGEEPAEPVEAADPALPQDTRLPGQPTHAQVLPTGIISIPESNRPAMKLVADRNGFFALMQRTTKVDVISLPKMVNIGALATGSKGNECLTISRDGLLAATGGDDHYIRVWNIPNQKMIKIFHSNAGTISLLEFSETSQFVAAFTQAGRLQIWDLNTSKMLQELSHHYNATAMRFSPDARYLFVGNQNSTISVYKR